MTDRTTLFALARVEGAHLCGLIDEFRELLAGAAATHAESDPGLERLTPDAYPDDPEAQTGFSEHTRTAIWDRRENDAARVRMTLDPFAADLSALHRGQFDEATATQTVPMALSAEDVDSWLRTLTALRLVIASRLGIETDDDHAPDDPRFAVYDWLGFRLDELIGIADDEEEDEY